MNISAPFLVDFFWDKMQAVIPYTDIIVANETEAAAYAKKAGWDEADLAGAAAKLAASPKMGSRLRTVIFTQGSKSTLVHHNCETKEYPVPAVPSEEIVDTNGAGDAFVGGLLAGFVSFFFIVTVGALCR
jgi:adenosine kinase